MACLWLPRGSGVAVLTVTLMVLSPPVALVRDTRRGFRWWFFTLEQFCFPHLTASSHEQTTAFACDTLFFHLTLTERFVTHFGVTPQNKVKEENEKLQKEIDDIKAQFMNGWEKSSLFPDWRKEVFQAVNVTLDPETAHPALLLSEERQQVTLGEKPQDLPKSQLRFESLPCVLGKEAISSGRCYWEVEVKNSTAWDLGVCRTDVMRKEKTYIKPEDGFWAIRLYKNEYWALTSPETQLTLRKRPSVVCIFLDYEGGCISFYNMTDKSHMYTFSQGSFSGSLRPFFRLWSSDPGHLDICPIQEKPGLE
ncbi:butyrophilin subfamily 1 member A1-like [Fukomys damarensis]|uniref:butyrophilin subfamily 1 member A1-like n=1 Tax=Fukomys damarensis TaxID=885580 RepID=UPI0014553697|nr:butyrophilin subfamily 1 member A1-like [Fukomys damarensis]